MSEPLLFLFCEIGEKRGQALKVRPSSPGPLKNLLGRPLDTLPYDSGVVPDSVVWSFCIFIPGVSPRNPLPEGPEELSYAILCQSELAGASHACLIISSEADEGGAIISSGSSERLSNESSGDPQNERKLTPSVLSRGPGTGQRGSELAQLSVSFVRPYSRIFRENLRVL